MAELKSATLYVVDGRVLTAAQRSVVQPIVTSPSYVVVPPFDESAPVTASATYNVTQGTKIVLVIEGSGNDTDTLGDQVRDVLVGASPDTVIRVVDVVQNEDGTVSVVIVVEESRADAVLDVVANPEGGVLTRVRRWFVEDDTSLGVRHALPALAPVAFLLLFLLFSLV